MTLAGLTHQEVGPPEKRLSLSLSVVFFGFVFLVVRVDIFEDASVSQEGVTSRLLIIFTENCALIFSR